MSGVLARTDAFTSLSAIVELQLSVHALVAAQGDAAASRYVEFFAPISATTTQDEVERIT